MKQEDFKALVSKTDAFMKTMYAVRDDLSLAPKKEHIATCINYSDLQEMRDEFIRELKNSIIPFTYSQQKQLELVQKFTAEGREASSAWTHLYEHVREKFRHSCLKGQFSELLLCNLLQHYFHAPPLMRKMPITTNPALERNGADAIHITKDENGKYILYIGEAKTYNRKNHALKDALKDSINDVIKHYDSHRKELNLYIHEDFLPKELQEVADNYKSGELTNIEVHLVCIVTYDDKNTYVGKTRDEILNSVIVDIKLQIQQIMGSKLFDEIPASLAPRMNYILFPVREMEELISSFQKALT